MSEAPPPAKLTFEQKIEKSQQVKFMEYDPVGQKLSVIFRGNPQFLYVYSDFPHEVWAELAAADSFGSFLYKNVTRPGQYQFEKLLVDEAGNRIKAGDAA